MCPSGPKCVCMLSSGPECICHEELDFVPTHLAVQDVSPDLRHFEALVWYFVQRSIMQRERRPARTRSGPQCESQTSLHKLKHVLSTLISTLTTSGHTRTHSNTLRNTWANSVTLGHIQPNSRTVELTRTKSDTLHNAHILDSTR